MTYSLAPAPPAGLACDAATRVLSGTPPATQNAAAYPYTVSSPGVVTGDSDDAYYNVGKGWVPIGNSAGNISASYAVGAVKSTGNNVGGLAGSDSVSWRTKRGTAANSCWDIGTTGQTASTRC